MRSNELDMARPASPLVRPWSDGRHRIPPSSVFPAANGRGAGADTCSQRMQFRRSSDAVQEDGMMGMAVGGTRWSAVLRWVGVAGAVAALGACGDDSDEIVG